MKFAATIFATAESISPPDVARALEDAGFEAVFFPDHTHVPAADQITAPGGAEMPAYYARTYDPLIAMAFAAQATARLNVGVGVCLVAQRDPIVLAKQVASLDVLSGGRVLFGVGAGWNPAEAANHGLDPAQRWSVMREHILAMKAIWANDVAAFAGRHVRFDPLWSWPKPLQRPHPPILVGGHGPRVMERVVAYGDEWLAMDAPGERPLAERIADLQALAATHGRGRIPVSAQRRDVPAEADVERCAEAGAERMVYALPSAPADVVLPIIAEHAALVRRFA